MGRNGLWVRHRSKRPRCTSSLEASPATGVSEHGVSEQSTHGSEYSTRVRSCELESTTVVEYSPASRIITRVLVYTLGR